jgi:guanylate kinase
MDKAKEFDEIVINDDLNATIKKIIKLIKEKQTRL